MPHVTSPLTVWQIASESVYQARRKKWLNDSWVGLQHEVAPRLRSFLHELAASRPGRVWWRAHSPLCGNKYGSWHDPRHNITGGFRGAPIDELNQKLRRSSYLILDALCGNDGAARQSSGAGAALRVVDAWKWTVSGGGEAQHDGEHCSHYPDFVHHPPLAEQQVAAVMDDMVAVLGES